VTWWRWSAAAALGLLIGVPVVLPFSGVFSAAAWDWQADDAARVFRLAANTLLLVGGTLLIVVPAGVLVALVLFRSRLPGRRLGGAILLLLLFVPVPVLASSWQSLLGQGGLWPLGLWENASAVDRPWATGWAPALWVLVAAGLPWIVLGAGVGFWQAPGGLEEEALQQVSRRRTIWRVTLPHSRAAVGAAALLVATFTANDIGVTGMMQIATFAEEYEVQFALGNEQALARTSLLALPLLLPAWGLLLALVSHLERNLPPLAPPVREPPVLVHRSELGLLVALVVGALAVLPLAGLVWNVGLAGRPPAWAPAHLGPPLANDFRLYGGQIVQTLTAAAVTAVVVTLLAVACCWLALDSPWLQRFLLVLLTLAWLLPGPVVGIGLKHTILGLVRTSPDGPWTDLLYRGPSPLPVMWAHTIRFLPVAVFLLWPVVRLVPRELREAARLDGRGPAAELSHAIWPLTRRAAGLTAVALAALCLGEVGAGGRVETPNWEPFAKLILDRMHYGIDRNVASLCLLLLGAVGMVGLALTLWRAGGGSPRSQGSTQKGANAPRSPT
jgi:ABC-type Fe3+ transport system permease subunit